MSAVSNLEAASMLTRAGGDGAQFALDLPEGWAQGRGVYGGLVVGALIQAIEQHTADPARKVRSVTAQLPGPATPGTSSIDVALLRRGSAVSTVRAQLAQGGEVKAHAVAVLAADRKAGGPAWQDLVVPESPPWRSVPVLPISAAPAGGRFAPPEFTQHFEFRVVEGIPMTGAAARTIGWIRPHQAVARRDAAYAAALADVWWPAAMVRMTRPRPIATIVFTLDLVAGFDGLDPDAPLLYRGTAPVAADGYFLETRELWGEDGRLIAVNQQTFVVIA